jgi:predicted protein tyrosine phosphatase
MKIKIHSFDSIEKFAKSPFPPKTALISIGDPDEDPPEMDYKPEHYLRLSFEDISFEEIAEQYKLPDDVSEEALAKLIKTKNIPIFTQEQAEKIAEFIVPILPEIELLICQCYYGVSRSAGCAAAISEFLYGNGIEIFADYKYFPNKWVYRKLIEALRKQLN